MCLQFVHTCSATKQDWCPSGTALHLFSELNVCTAQAVLDKYTSEAAAEAFALSLSSGFNLNFCAMLHLIPVFPAMFIQRKTLYHY